MSTNLIYLNESQVEKYLTWPLVYDAVEQALYAIPETKTNDEQPTAEQPARSFTRTPSGVLLTMPGFIANYPLTSVSGSTNQRCSTLACKLVTSFLNNTQLNPPKPKILANILVLDHTTGELQAVVAGTEITTWRTGVASIVSTDHLYFKTERAQPTSQNVLAIVGCGVQGRSHAIGFCTLHNFSKVILWNRTEGRAIELCMDLNGLKSQFKNPNVNIQYVNSVEDCVKDANIIVTATTTSTPLLCRSMIKDNVHINAVGAGQNHHAELSLDIYQDPNTQIYVDNWASARTELRTLDAVIIGEVGDVISGIKAKPTGGITVFQSMGMAIEDGAVAQAILEKYRKSNN